MAPRTLPALLLLAAAGFIAAQDDGAQLKAAVQEKEALAKKLAALQEEVEKREAEPWPAPEDAPLRLVNNASNDVVLANCLESYELKAGEEIRTTLMTGGFWVLPEGADFNCSVGCEACFYVSMQWTVDGGASVRIGFGPDAEARAAGAGGPVRPQGGGLKLSVSGSGSAQCTDESCDAGWTSPIPIDVNSSLVDVTIEGSQLADQKSNSTAGGAAGGAVEAAMLRGRIGGRIGGFRRPAFRRPVYRRPIFRRPIVRRPVWRRPVYRRPIYRPIYRPVVPAPACYWCNQYRRGSCWWLCQ